MIQDIVRPMEQPSEARRSECSLALCNPDGALTRYEETIRADREAADRRMERLQRECPPELLGRFLIELHAMEAAFARHVPGWIGRATAACDAGGIGLLGMSCVCGLEEKNGRYLRCLRDLDALVEMFDPGLSPRVDGLVDQVASSPCAREYLAVNEDVIEGEVPLAWFAIHYEVEALTSSFWPGFAAGCVERLGCSVAPALGFAIFRGTAVRHDARRVYMMANLLELWPSSFDAFVRAGKAALESHSRCFEQAFERATADREVTYDAR